MGIFQPNIKKHRLMTYPEYIAKQLHVDYQLSGVTMVYQRYEVIPGGDCETIGDWAETISGEFDVTATGSGKVGSNSITMTQTDADGLGAIYLLFAAAQDLRWAQYIGYWYQGGDDDVFTASDIELYLFTDPTNFAYANAARKITAVPTFTEKATAVWKYNEILISDMTLNSGYEGVSLKEVWGLGFYSDAGVDGNFLVIDHIEFYVFGTGYGPARGQIKAAVISDGVTVAKGNGLAWELGSGRVKISVDNEPSFAGIAIAAGTAVGAEKGEGIAYFVVDGPVHMLCNDAAIADQEGVACSAAGGVLTVDDGGGSSLPFNIGKATEAGATGAVIVVLLGDARGTTA